MSVYNAPVRRLLILLASTVACGVAPVQKSDPSITTAQIEATTGDWPSFDTVTSAGGSGGPSGSTNAKVDVGSGDWTLSPACGRLDLLFVVERSFTTSARMHADAPAIFDALESALPGWSVQIIAVEGRVGTIPGFCEEACVDGECEESWEPVKCSELSACDWTRGAGMVWDGPATRCIDGPHRWVDPSTPSALDDFRCLWGSATGAGDIDTITSLLEAVSIPNTAIGGCNAEFLRDDAFLVPVIVTHGRPTAPGSPATWAEELAAVKGDERDHVRPVVILDPQTQPWDPPGCEEGPGDDGRYAAFAEIFDGVVGSLCTDYSTPVLEAVARIAERCVDAPG